MNKVLVIDDDEALRQTLEVALQYFGYEVTTASDGAEGISRAREWLPDVILCDVNMPGMDGKAVLLAMRKDPVLSHRQIVLMTGNQTQNPQREGMDLGADDYLAKPFEIIQLKACIDVRLRRAQTARRLEEGALRRHANLFGSTLPHEFMTPLNGILGFAEILREDIGRIPQAEAVQMLTDIESCARRLHRTLMNYITLVTIEIEAESAALQNPVVIGADRALPIISAAAQDLANKAGRDADLRLELSSLGFQCREEDLRSIAEHLIENALGFSAAGSAVIVALRLVNGRPTLSVEDHGRGMTPEQIEQIGMFMQFDRKRFEQQGLGIGLALVKRLLDRNHAQLRFVSTPGRGTTATVEFQSGR